MIVEHRKRTRQRTAATAIVRDLSGRSKHRGVTAISNMFIVLLSVFFLSLATSAPRRAAVCDPRGVPARSASEKTRSCRRRARAWGESVSPCGCLG